MRKLATLLLGLALLTPGLASARPVGSAQCRHLSSQIEFFQGRVERARKLRNDVWVERFGDHLAGLEKQRKDRCPGYGDSEEAYKILERLIQLAAKGAITFFTLGAL